MKTLTIIAVVLLTGCQAGNWQTVAPRVVVAQTASFDGDKQNSGILSAGTEGFIVTQHFMDRFAAYAREYGSREVPPITPPSIHSDANGNYIITSQAMSQFLTLNRWRKADVAP